MLESSYKKPFWAALFISLSFVAGMSFSLHQMVGTGSGLYNTEVSFMLSDEGDDAEHLDVHIEDHQATEDASGHGSSSDRRSTPGDLNRLKEPTVKSITESGRDFQWAPQKAIETEDTPDNAVVRAERKERTETDKLKFSKPSTIPGDGIEGNGLPQEEVDGDLSFMNPMALNLLSPGLQEQLRPTPEKNAKSFLERVAAQAKRSSIKGSVVVRVNFSEDGEVQYTNVIDAIDPAVKNAAIDIIWNSGTMENRTGRPLMLAVPVILGQ